MIPENYYGLMLTFISSLLWAFFDASRKVLTNKISPIPLLLFLSFFQGLFLLLIILFQGNSVDLLWAKTDFWLPTIITAIMYASGSYYFIKSITISPLSSVIPFLSFSVVLTEISSYFLLGESVGLIQILGIVLLTISFLLINAKKLEANPVKLIKSLWQDFMQEPGCRLMILVSIMWSLGTTVDKIAVVQTTNLNYSFLQSVLAVLLFIGTYLYKKPGPLFKGVKENFVMLIASSLFFLFAYIAQMEAVINIKVALLESMKRSVTLFGSLIFGFFLFKEKISKFKLLACFVIVCALALILYS